MKDSTKKKWVRGLIIIGVIILPFGIPIAAAYGLYNYLRKDKEEDTSTSTETENQKGV